MEKAIYFSDLIAWKQGHELSLQIYQTTDSFPSAEKFGLVSQMRRSVVSVTSNFAEGFGRRGILDKIRFYDIAIGSLYELQSQLYLSKDLHFVDDLKFRQLFQSSLHV